MKKQRDIIIHFSITIIGIFFILLLIPKGSIFGSSTDWFSQHVQIADTLRTSIYEHGLFYDYVDLLGGGQNIYAFSYYGLFRPDLLLSLLLPAVAMKDIIITYMIFNFILSLNLLYYFLKQHKIDMIPALIAVALLALSSFIFHSHRQIMFVNYMPYLLLSMILIDRMFKKKCSYPLIISSMLIILHSFFFSVSSFFVLGIYFLYNFYTYNYSFKRKEDRKLLWKFIICILLGIMISAILLLPTGLVLLEHSRCSGIFNLSILIPDISYKNLLYDKYGMGLTMIAWIGLCLGLRNKKNRYLSIGLMLCLSLPIITYLLNGTLYLRAKIFITFLPLLLFVIAHAINDLIKQPIEKFHPWILLFFLPLLLSNNLSVIVIDTVICLIVLILYHITKKPVTLLLCISYPLVVCMENNAMEDYVTKKSYQNAMSIKEDQNLNNYTFDSDYRFDDIRYTLSNVNYAATNMKRTTMYTSINNSIYNKFFYDIAYNAIPTRNRVITSLQNNYIFQELMGVRYLYTNKNYTPYGYKTVYENGKIRLLENENVLPIAYATSNVISEQNFNELTYPNSLDALYRYTIVNNSSKTPGKSTITKSNTTFSEVSRDDTLSYSTYDDMVKIDSSDKSKLKLQSDETLENKMLLIQFDVKDISNIKTKDLSITINGITNKLSSKTAPYPNNNTTFTYILSADEAIDTLNITFSKGEYTLENISIYELPYSTQKKDSITALDTVKSDSVLKGSIDVKEDAYFITSLPMQNGYEVYVDGKKQEYETVNKAFLGFKISEGKHEIEIKFTAPGKTVGIIVSVIAIILAAAYIIIERRGYYENNN